MKTQTELLAESSGKSSSVRKGLKATSSKPSLADVTPQEEDQEQKLYISVYKAKVGNASAHGDNQILTWPLGRLGVHISTPHFCFQVLRDSKRSTPKTSPFAANSNGRTKARLRV